MEHEELEQEKAVAVVAASARRLFPVVSEQQARDLAARGVRLIRDRPRA